MRQLKKISLIFCLMLCQAAFSQNEFSKWYFGYQAGLDFSTNPPTVLTNGIINTAEGMASIGDANGNLLFYTDGISVINSTHQLMANGSGLFGSGSSTQAALIVKQPGNDSLYYVFTTNIGTGGTHYSVVNMKLAAGLGSVTVKNAPLYSPSNERQVAIRHCNGKDIWIMSHHTGSNQFRAYLLSSSGVSTTPVTSAIGGVIMAGVSSIGQLKISPNGKKLAMATATTIVPIDASTGGFHLFDFDPATGTVSNSLTLLSITQAPNNSPYGVEFSPDGSKLYGTTSAGSGGATVSAIYQWDLCAGNNQAIVASQYSINGNSLTFGSVQKAINGKIYISASIPAPQYSLSVINNPNAAGAAMGFVLNGQSTAPKKTSLGLPNYINPYTRPLPGIFSSTLACQSASFSAPAIAPAEGSSCTGMITYIPNAYAWNFGDPASGANTSTLANPVHIYSGTGSYTTSLILYGNCTNDTLKNVITVTTPGPTLTLEGKLIICKGEKQTYTASGATSFLWSTNAASSTLALSPANTSTYSLSGTLNGCTLSKIFTVTVNPCVGIASTEQDQGITIFPNPFKDQLQVELLQASHFSMTDVNGKILYETEMNKGKNEIKTSELKAGMYFINVKNNNNNWRARFIKID